MIIAVVSSFYVHVIKKNTEKNHNLILEMVFFCACIFNGSLSISVDAFLMWRFVDIFDGIKANACSQFGISQLSLVVDLTTSTMKVKTKESNFCVRSPLNHFNWIILEEIVIVEFSN